MPLARRDFLLLGGIAALAAAGGGLFGVFRLRSAKAADALLAEPFADLRGGVTRLKDWSSPVLLCNFWATWCEPCRVEVPVLIAARRDFADKGLEIAGIGIDDAAKLQNFAKSFGIPYPILVGSGSTSELMRNLGNEAGALPYSVILNRERRITATKLGKWTAADLEREIGRAIG